MPDEFRGIITGHGTNGPSVVLSADPLSRTLEIGGEASATFFELWNTAASSAPVVGHPEDPVAAAAEPSKHR